MILFNGEHLWVTSEVVELFLGEDDLSDLHPTFYFKFIYNILLKIPENLFVLIWSQ